MVMSVPRRSSLIWLLSLPLAFLGLCYGLARCGFRASRSVEQVKAADRVRQSEVRRELRGLSPEHDQRDAAR
jgi:hypothetical protein